MIPISPDVRQLIGDWAEAVENRSLLHQKFALPKESPVGGGKKLDQASRWSVLRIVSRGSQLLADDASNLRKQANRLAQKNPDKAGRLMREASVAEKMATVAKAVHALPPAANANAASFLGDLAKSFGGRVETFEATLGARLLVNLAGGVIENAGIALDRCFGLPIIPGSAVKGITRSQALWEIREATGDDKSRLLTLAMLLFGYGANDIKSEGDFGWAGGSELARKVSTQIGNDDFKGCACFLPAYPTTPPEIEVDMVNPHYPNYYGGRRPRAEDNENPEPNYFPAVRAGCAFGFAVLLNRRPEHAGATAEQLLGQAKDWLQRAVTTKGAGAKTGAGYGWFVLGRKTTSQNVSQPPSASGDAPSSTTEAAGSTSPAERLISKWRNKLAMTGNFIAALPEIAALEDDKDVKRVFELLIPERERRLNRKNNPYWQSFTSGRHGEAGKRILARAGFKLL
ncbi:MAG: hypothetical protein BWX48_03707 [Verrucomicrobia bacterium ADurb.Bin006]|nr:MAG: hypothetical protein BWX48_03707 [Verrucomicrobia bacterium ADurb.Bin006]HOF49562.1 type III-B CRISPR module RAMP protein Cmr6 [Verrucomicrobiota bacterium]